MRDSDKITNLIDRALNFGTNETYSYLKEFLYHTVTDAYLCPVKLWIPRLWMTMRYIPKFILDTIREWRAVTKILEWEIWIPDWEETKEEFFNRTKQVIAANSYQTDAPPGRKSKHEQLQPEGKY